MGSMLDDIVGGTAGGGDDEVSIDYSGAVDFEPVPAGRYGAKVLKCEHGLSKEKKAPQLKWTFGLSDEGVAGRQVTRYSPLTGKGSGITKQILKALGYDTSDTTMKFSPSSAIGRECQVDLIIDPNNTDFNEVKRVHPATAAPSPLG